MPTFHVSSLLELAGRWGGEILTVLSVCTPLNTKESGHVLCYLASGGSSSEHGLLMSLCPGFTWGYRRFLIDSQDICMYTCDLTH